MARTKKNTVETPTVEQPKEDVIQPVKQEKISVTVQPVTPSKPSRLTQVHSQPNNTVRVHVKATGMIRTMNRKDAERLVKTGGFKIVG